MNSEGTILLVEDNPDDVFFMQRACQGANISNPLQVADDGQIAIDYLGGVGPYADRAKFPDPCLILLDLKLPRKTGHEVLAWLRQQPDSSSVIVLALTTSREPRDIAEAYRLGVNAYLVKPTSPSDLTEMMVSIKGFWLNHNVVE
jgi:CheY-like chemotaxis protein